MTKPDAGTFIFKKTDHIGANDAEHDSEFLAKCFVDTGNLDILKGINDHRQILLGRTGSGKSALIEKIKWTFGDQVIMIEPEALALTYVSNSTILQYFSDLGVNLDPFFKLLWRHVFTVEVLNRHLAIPAADKNTTLIDRLRDFFSSESKKDREMNEAIQYLQQWGEHFWEQTEFRIKEIASKIEDKLGAEITAETGISLAKLKAGVHGTETFSEEQKSQLVNRGQKIISEAQVQDLTKVIKLLDNVLDDRQKKYFILIDGLDENWVEERLRYKLIMALIQTARDFYKVRSAKVIIAIRRDLIERVFKITRDSGFQEEKFQSLYLPLTWNKNELIEVLDKRVAALVSKRYTKEIVSYKDLLPKKYKKTPITDYISNIVLRPRDVIALFNSCILFAANKSKLSSKEFKNAEGEYSRNRLHALGDEWNSSYPALLDFTKILCRRPPSFKLKTVIEKDIGELCLDMAIKNPGGQGFLQQYAMQVANCVVSVEEFKSFLFLVFYQIGLLGLKLEPHESASWADEFGKGVSRSEITPETSAVIHPMYYRVLGITPHS